METGKRYGGEDMERHKIGSFIAEMRKSKGMTQQQLAGLLNVSNKTVSKWECSESYPEITLIPVIANIFGVTADEILRGELKSEKAPAAGPDTAEDGEREKGLLKYAIAKYKSSSFIAIGVMVIGFISGLALAFGLQIRVIGFCVTLMFVAAGITTEAVNISRTYSVLDGSAVRDAPAVFYEVFFRNMIFVFSIAAAAVLLALPLVVELFGFPDGMVIATDFEYYWHSARYMALVPIALYPVAIFITYRLLETKSRYSDVCLFPGKRKIIAWLSVIFLLIVL